jgi:vacuolar-type H+-ATPase subunit I/STV1
MRRKKMDIIEGVRVAMKEMMLPELDRIREDNKEIKATLFMINKRLDDVNLHLADQSRRIDAAREEMSGRIDLLSVRIDSLHENLGGRIDSMAQKFDTRMDRLYEVIVRRDEHALAERRIATLEKDVADIRLRLAA